MTLSAKQRDRLRFIVLYGRAVRKYVRGLEFSWNTVFGVVGFLAIAVFAVAAVWALKEIPRWQISALAGSIAARDPVKAFELENEARKTLTQIVLGAFGLLVLWFTWRRVRVAEQGHITDRYTQAIEQLGKLRKTNET
jgi:hypothetical protein